MVSMWAAMGYGAPGDDDERFYWPEEIPPDVDDDGPANSVDDGPTNSVEPSKQRPDVDSEPLRDSRRNSVDGDGGGAKRKSQAAVLVELAINRYELHFSTDGVPFATPKSGPRIAFPLRGGPRSLRAELAASFFREHGTPPSAQALTDAVTAVESVAAESSPVRWWLRVAEAGGAVWLDLGDPTGRCVRIAAGKWQVVGSPPDGLFFRRSRTTLPLPEPAQPGDLDPLWRLLPVAEEDRPLLLAWLIAALRPDIPHPLLIFSGEAGSGKTTAARIITEVLDPTSAGVRALPSDSTDWHVAMSSSWVAAFDNATVINAWQTDALCRAVTGDAMIKRRLYTDDDVIAVAYRRPVIITSVDLGALRGDLADRALLLPLRRIPEDQRRGDEDIAAAWQKARPQVLAGLLDLAAAVLDTAKSINPGWSPRMADFWRVVIAVDTVLGTDGASRYVEAARQVIADTTSSDPVTSAIIERLPSGFTGNARQLLEAITPDDDRWRPPKGWPATPRSLTVKIRNAAPALRSLGWQVDDRIDSHAKTVQWTIIPPTVAGQATSAAGQAEPLTRKDPNRKPQVRTGVAGQAGQAGQVPPSSLAGTPTPRTDQREGETSTRITRNDPPTITCEHCGLTLDPVLVDLGLRTHPTCEGW